MMIYGAIVLSFLITLGFYLFNKTQYRWWEFFVAPAATTIVVVLFKLLFGAIGDNYTETWGSTIVSIYEQEPYNYWQHQTCYRTMHVGKTSYTVPYDCSHQVNVSPKWYAVTDLKETINITEHQYDSLLIQFGNIKSVSDQHKNHDSRDRASGSRGTKFEGKSVGSISYEYKTDWLGTDNTRKAVSTQHRYTNKVKASDLTIFNISLVHKKQADSLKLFNYPKFSDKLTYPTILGDSLVSKETQEKFRRLNGKFGPTNQMRLWVLVFEDRPSMIAKYQENYWVRGNMNELVICIGKKDTTLQWCDVFSWTTSESLKIEIRDHITGYTFINEKVWDDLYIYLDNNLNKYVRRDFAEFDYLKRRIKLWEIIVAYVFGIAAAIGANFWCTKNEYDDDDEKRDFRYDFYNIKRNR
jgi:hypothetical protein